MHWCFTCRRFVACAWLARGDCDHAQRMFEGYVTEREEIELRRMFAEGTFDSYEAERTNDPV